MRRFFLIMCFAIHALTGFSQRQETRKISANEYRDKVYAAWLGQCIGNFVGLPHECQHIEYPGSDSFPLGYTGSISRMKEANGAFSDDDTDIEYMYLLAMEKYGTEPTYSQIRETWLNHITTRVWLANRAALTAMRVGYTPPVTGMKEYNPHWFQIDPQLVNEIWGITAPGMVQYAAQKSDWFARVTNDSWGVEPTIHYGAMFSAAFFESDIHKLIDIGTSALPKGSRFAQTVEDMKALHIKYPNDWKQARKEMAEKYYYNEPDDTRTVWNANLNGACGILALLYGNGDFQKTLYYSCLIGFDADNQAATMCGLVALINGTKALPEKYLFPFPELGWKEPFNDLYKNVSRDNMPDASIKDMAKRTVQQAEKIILANGGQKIIENGEEYYTINTNAIYRVPLEIPNGRLPIITKGTAVAYNFPLSGNTPNCKWSIVSGKIPEGLTFSQGRLSGTPHNAGIYPIRLKVKQGKISAFRDYNIIVRGKNYAPSATSILSNVQTTSASTRDSMWVSVSHSMFAKDISILNDEKVSGEGSVFYSINQSFKPKMDFYGYEWKQKKQIGLIGFHTGCMEEFGGWFRTLSAEYLDDSLKWKPVQGLKLMPELINTDNTDIKPDFMEYLLVFKPVNTKAIRIIGEAGGGNHWFSGNKTPFFTSISELAVYEPLLALASFLDKSGATRINHKNVSSPGLEQNSSYQKYKTQLAQLRKEFSEIELPDVKFFLFGMGNRTKLLYKNGKLINSITGETIHEWECKNESIIPNDYTVKLETESGKKISIYENEKGVFISENNADYLIPGTDSPVVLPRFEGYKYSEILKVLHSEILVNIVDSKPLPNYFVYKNPWRRDAAMMAMCLNKTGNINLIRNWALALTDPFDRNNKGESEADNLGQTLYILSFFTDKTHPLVAKILAEIPKFEVNDSSGRYIRGRTDFHEAPLYQTKWLKYGLKSLNLEDSFSIPKIQDDYSAFIWWAYKDSYMAGTKDADYNPMFYPLIRWSAGHFHGIKNAPVTNREYPLSWEMHAGADYNGMALIDNQFVKDETAMPHCWHATEMFLYLLEFKD